MQMPAPFKDKPWWSLELCSLNREVSSAMKHCLPDEIRNRKLLAARGFLPRQPALPCNELMNVSRALSRASPSSVAACASTALISSLSFSFSSSLSKSSNGFDKENEEEKVNDWEATVSDQAVVGLPHNLTRSA